MANYAVKAGVVCWHVKLCDPQLSALEVSFYTNLPLSYLYLTSFLFPYAVHSTGNDIMTE